ncbi:MAG: hypothetical protein P8129_13335 [Anaerolineae bacterium]|jgi:hypothetical protein
MEDWMFDEDMFWDEDEFEDEDYFYELVYELSERFFLSNNEYLPNDPDHYNLGYLEAEDWWPLVDAVSKNVILGTVVTLCAKLDDLLGLGGLPTELLEDPHVFLQSVLNGNLPPEPSGRRVGSRKLVRIASLVLEIIEEVPELARATVHGWAIAQRAHMGVNDFDDLDEEDLSDLLLPGELPPAMTGFSMMIALTLMRWPQRAEGLPLPADFEDPDTYESVLAQWEALPGGPTAEEEGMSPAEAFFAQGQLAHMLAQMGAVELLSPDEEDEEQEISLAYSRLSRAILWVHDQCRFCPEREEVACKAATFSPQRPTPLVDVAGEVANTGRIAGCIKM